MKKILKSFIILIILLVFCINTSFAYDPVKKLGRGLANTLTGWIELPATIARNCEKHGCIAGPFYGVPMGVVKAVSRTAVGVYEVLTFPFAIPEDYEPIMEPEFVMESALESME